MTIIAFVAFALLAVAVLVVATNPRNWPALAVAVLALIAATLGVLKVL